MSAVDGCTAVRHGTASAYNNHRCRCRAARKERTRQVKQRHLNGRTAQPSVGTRRRVEALQWMGWPAPVVAGRCGRSAGWLYASMNRWRSGGRVEAQTARRVAAVYDELAMLPGPSPSARRLARAAGLVGPLDWDDIDTDPAPVVATAAALRSWVDWVAVDRCAHGLVPASRLTPAEHDAVVARLHADGLNDCQIGERCGLVPRSVLRIRQRLGLPAARGWTQKRPAA